MTINGDVLEIELDDDLPAVVDLKEFVQERLAYIDEIVIVGEKDVFATSALFQLLVSIKQSKPEIKIPIIDDGILNLAGYGKLYWIK